MSYYRVLMRTPTSDVAAFAAWRNCLGDDRVDAGPDAERRYGTCTTGTSRRISGALRPRDVVAVADILAIARQHLIPLYPISTGRNWGYGSGNPVVDGCVVVDLSEMNRIVEFDRQLALVTVEPGVTQGQLRTFLDLTAPELMVPTTGAGPTCSLVGNALERGYGITPYADHFGAVMALEAVLPDGTLYRSPLTELGGDVVDRAFKWGIGPYLDGLFAQGNFGIVTRMTIALATRPECVQGFFFGVPEEAGLETAVLTIQRALRAAGGTLGSINLMNTRRVLAMTVSYPSERTSPGGILAPEVIDELAHSHSVSPWTGIGALYGSHDVVKGARKVIRRLLGPIADRIRFITPEGGARLNRFFSTVPVLRATRMASRMQTLEKALRVMAGEPSEVALRAAYWRGGERPQGGHADPARDGCGLIWYSPLVPMKSDAVRLYVDLVNETCMTHGIEPLITLTTLSDRCFDSSVPLLFDRRNLAETERATTCYDALFEAGRRQGFLPYRVGVSAMRRLTETPAPFWDLVRTIKAAVDPGDVVAPGRYAPTAVTGSAGIAGWSDDGVQASDVRSRANRGAG